MNDRSNVLARLARAVAGSKPDAPLPLRMCRACVSLLGVDGGSITLAYDAPQRVTLCSTDGIAERMEDLHEVIGEGPSLWAYQHGTAVSTVVDGAADERWPQFAESVKREIGRLSIYAIPIIPESQDLQAIERAYPNKTAEEKYHLACSRKLLRDYENGLLPLPFMRALDNQRRC